MSWVVIGSTAANIGAGAVKQGKGGGGGGGSVPHSAFAAEYFAGNAAREGQVLSGMGSPLRAGVTQNLIDELGYGLPPAHPGLFNWQVPKFFADMGIRAAPSGGGSGSANLSPLRDATESAYSTAQRQVMESSASRGGALNYNLDQLARGRAAQLGQNRLALLKIASDIGATGAAQGLQGYQLGISGSAAAGGIAQQGQMQQAMMAQQNQMAAGQGKGNLLGLALMSQKGRPSGTSSFTQPSPAMTPGGAQYSGLPSLSTTF